MKKPRYLESDQTFWYSPSLEELERLQNVAPVADVKYLYGTWPGDDDDGFEDAIDALRHPGGHAAEPRRAGSSLR